MSSETKPRSPSSDASASPNPTPVEPLPAAPSQPRRSFFDRLPTWVVTNIRSKQSRKMLFRCWLSSWAALVIILPEKSLKTMGNAAFFALLTSLFLPPSFPVQLFIFTISTLMIGVFLGWGLGAAGMRAAIASRNEVLLKSSLLQAEQTAAGSANPDQVFKIEIFQGQFLDTWSSVIFGVFMAVGLFFFAIIRAYYKSLIFMSVFGTVAIDIFCTIGPLFPFGQYNLLNSLLIPVSTYTGIAVVVTILVFPRTANHAFLETATLLLSQIKLLLDAQEDLLTSAPGSITPGSPKYLQLRATRVSMFTIHRGLTMLGKFINAEFSWGRWSGDDARKLEEPLFHVMFRMNGLMGFVRSVGRNVPYPTAKDQKSVEEIAQDAGTTNTFLVQQMYRCNEAKERQHSLRLVDLLPRLREATFELRSAASHALTAVSGTINFVNATRWSWRSTADAFTEQERSLDSAAERLRNALAEFKAKERLRLLEPFEPHIGSPTAPLRSLYLCYVFSASTIVVSEAILAVVETVQEITSKRTKNRLWAPKGLRQLAHALFVEKSTEGDLHAYGESPEVEEIVPEPEEDYDQKYRRDPDSRPPTNALQKIMSGLHAIYQWTKTPEAVFVFRYVFVSIALWVPAVVRRTAHFYYVEKGVWALIMAQTTLTVYAGDQLFNYFARLTSTFIGLVLGLVVWYIGNAQSHGNAYGTAASVAVFLVPIMFIRLFAPQEYLQSSILFASTVVLIVGYSWVDGHLPVISNVGIGWPVAWRRWTLVMIGSAASFVVMILPPKSARKAVRLGCAKTVTSLSHMYALIMSTWIRDAVPSKELKSGLPPWANSFRKNLTAVALQLNDLKETARLARWEGSVRGHWPYEEYNKLVDVQQEMVTVFSQLASALYELDDDWRSDFLHHTEIVNPNFISDLLSVFSLVGQSLRTGEPMHAVLPQSLLDRLLYHDAMAGITPVTTTGIDHARELRSLNYLFYATGVICVLQITELLDELHSITRNLCGEVPFRGFEQWKDVHQRAHVPTAPSSGSGFGVL